MDRHERAAPARVGVGIAVSTAALEVALRPAGTAWRDTNDDAGLAERVARLPPGAPQVSVLEASGGWERRAVAAVARAGRPVAVVHPRPVRDLATATGRVTTTAAWDAVVRAPCAEALRPPPRPLPDAPRPARAGRAASAPARRLGGAGALRRWMAHGTRCGGPARGGVNASRCCAACRAEVHGSR
jgi:transposase